MHVRTRLILSYAVIIALCLALSVLVSALLFQTYQNRFVRQRIETVAEATAPLLHDNNDPAKFDTAEQLRRTAAQTQTRLILLDASLRDLTTQQNRPPQARNNVTLLTATVAQDSAELLSPGTTVPIPREIYESWQQWQRAQTAQATPNATPSTPKNLQLTLPAASIRRVTLPNAPPLNLALLPLRAERGAPSGTFRILVVAEPLSTVDRSLTRVAGTLLPAAGVAFLCSLVVAFFIARSITRPLLRLTAATRALAQGDYSQRVTVRGQDEVAELGHSFNALVEDIASARRRERDTLANISHDLKTPLTSIQGFAGALVDGTCPPDEYPNAARIIYDEAGRMSHLVGDILQLSRLEAGELPLTQAPLNLSDLLQATAHRFSEQATQAGITLRLTLHSPTPLLVLGDYHHLEQILGNLVENALRHTPAGGRIELVGEPQTQGDQLCARISVRDTGSGIRSTDLPHIFERFYQADKARAAGRTGSGLGLAITKGLVERHGGTVFADSVIGAGTTIGFTIPLHPQPTPQTSAPRPATTNRGGV